MNTDLGYETITILTFKYTNHPRREELFRATRLKVSNPY